MAKNQSGGPSHLPSLSIVGYRGIRDLHIPKLGGATLLAGKNGTGKTTVLEAVRAYAARGREAALSSVLRNREEFLTTLDEDADMVVAPNLAALFHGRDVSGRSRITIGPVHGSVEDALTIEVVEPGEDQAELFDTLFDNGASSLLDSAVLAPVLLLQISHGGRQRVIPWFMFSRHDPNSIARYRLYRKYRFRGDSNDLSPATECQLLGPGLLRNDEAVRYWDSVVLREEDSVVQALNLVASGTVERVALRGTHERSPHTQRFEVRIKGRDEPVPLRSLGDGAVRFFGAAIALAKSQDGFLLIDEAENGIHHSVQASFWRMMLPAAAANNVQVIATTHSFSCVRGFARAAAELPDARSVLVRLERDGDQTRAVTYDQDQMMSAAEHGIEVR